MPSPHPIYCAGVLLGLLASTTLPSSSYAADLVLRNASVYTVDAERSRARVIAIESGRIVYVGDDAGQHVEDDTKVVDLGGQMVLPAFQDVHIHLGMGGVSYTSCPVFDLPDRQAVLAAIRDCVKARPNDEVIRGTGWTISQFTGRLPPEKELLDAIDDTRPLIFGDADGHAMWMNSAAFEEYGITSQTPDPPGGMIARHPETGEPRGTVHEESGFRLVTDKWPPFSDEEIMAGLRYAQDYLHSLGITAFQEAIVKLNGRDYYRTLPAFFALNQSGELKLRASLSLFWEAGNEQQLQTFKQARDTYSGGRLRVNTVKFWADGVVETHTARMLEPYTDLPDSLGLMMIPRNELIAGVTAVDAAGFQAHIHAIGDATVRYGLDAVAAAWQANGRRDARHHLNHVQFIHPDDIGRFKELDVGASFEPYWAVEDEYITQFTLPHVGPERIQRTYAINSLLSAGARVAFSSDWSVSSADPLLGMETAVTRVDPHSNQGKPFLPGERITLEQAIAAYTINAAYLNHLDETTGSIEAGKYADLVVLDRDLFEIPASEISDVKLQATLFEGEVVFGALTGDR
jgi:predicted amidohydrolase YtcJ